MLRILDKFRPVKIATKLSKVYTKITAYNNLKEHFKTQQIQRKEHVQVDRNLRRLKQMVVWVFEKLLG